MGYIYIYIHICTWLRERITENRLEAKMENQVETQRGFIGCLGKQGAQCALNKRPCFISNQGIQHHARHISQFYLTA